MILGSLIICEDLILGPCYEVSDFELLISWIMIIC